MAKKALPQISFLEICRHFQNSYSIKRLHIPTSGDVFSVTHKL